MNVMKIVELLIYSKTAFEMEDTYLFSTKLFFQIGSDEYDRLVCMKYDCRLRALQQKKIMCSHFDRFEAVGQHSFRRSSF